ncbi:MFS transporter [Nocardioides anomalus]|uniref:MFS transporter n=1 Tax=Nocardioides anomalus TaxID=2712223 RepID=A0A6G6WE42_9ACTN|nr:MFS transporter [Nocardioides anomalus]QIG43310.1 MFS transporter [Nocardioides anomalus]
MASAGLGVDGDVRAAAAPPRTLAVVLEASGLALVLHLAWLALVAGTGGDLAAQDAWTGFALAHPTSAYDFAWYGGMHPASYSLLSPYVMGALGVRTTMVVAGTVSAGLVALLLTRFRGAGEVRWTGLYAALAVTGNALSGRATFGLGLVLGLGALAVVFAWPRGPGWTTPTVRWTRGAAAATLAGLATAASPVAGLFLGLVAAALWFAHRRAASLALGVVPVVVVVATSALFPFFGVQPFPGHTALVPFVLAVACWFVLPRSWRLARMSSAVYGAAVLAVWLVPTPIGTNITRLALLFAGVALLAATRGAWWTSAVGRRLGRRAARSSLAVALVTALVYPVVIVAQDVAGSSSAATLDTDVGALVDELDQRGAELGRVEVVPSRSHREASALAPHVNLARGWNRQADVARNALFYRDDVPLSAEQYEHWLHRWAVRFVVLPASTLDYAALDEGRLVRAGLPFLTEVWSDATWTLYQVADPAPLVRGAAALVAWDDDRLTVRVDAPGTAVLRIAWSPWLSIVDDDGDRVPEDDLGGTCLAQHRPDDDRAASWVVLHASTAGTYRIGAPYSVPRGTPCETG